eukprot:Sspe_Gene.26723::Locus_11239_Transcript_1_1_Confidence_1.000_Length_1795::g.26723::m.26723
MTLWLTHSQPPPLFSQYILQNPLPDTLQHVIQPLLQLTSRAFTLIAPSLVPLQNATAITKTNKFLLSLSPFSTDPRPYRLLFHAHAASAVPITSYTQPTSLVYSLILLGKTGYYIGETSRSLLARHTAHTRALLRIRPLSSSHPAFYKLLKSPNFPLTIPLLTIPHSSPAFRLSARKLIEADLITSASPRALNTTLSRSYILPQHPIHLGIVRHFHKDWSTPCTPHDMPNTFPPAQPTPLLPHVYLPSAPTHTPTAYTLAPWVSQAFPDWPTHPTAPLTAEALHRHRKLLERTSDGARFLLTITTQPRTHIHLHLYSPVPLAKVRRPLTNLIHHHTHTTPATTKLTYTHHTPPQIFQKHNDLKQLKQLHPHPTPHTCHCHNLNPKLRPLLQPLT